MDKIVNLATKFRSAIENAKYDRRFMYDQHFCKFPRACCGITSDLLAKFFIDNGITEKITYISGTYYNKELELPSHAWLEIGDTIVVDITGDQFKFYPEPLRFAEEVYVGVGNDFFDLFTIHNREDYGKNYILDDTSSCYYLSRDKLYSIILEYIE